ncbi:MAG: hypothetical protein ACO1N5_02085 [Noviherbaspirillum sp.]
MAHSLVSTYDNFAAAEHARDALLASGFPSSSIFLSSQQDDTGARTSTALADSHGKEQGYIDVSGASGDQAQGTASSLAVERTQPDSYLLTVDADDPAELERASGIVSRYGALDVSQRTVIGKGDEA